MKLTLAANNKFNNIKIEKRKDGTIDRVIIDFDCCYAYSDLEGWLTDEKDNYLDRICLNVSKRNKLQAHK